MCRQLKEKGSVLPEPLPSLVLGQRQTDNKDRHLSLAEPVSPINHHWFFLAN